MVTLTAIPVTPKNCRHWGVHTDRTPGTSSSPTPAEESSQVVCRVTKGPQREKCRESCGLCGPEPLVDTDVKKQTQAEEECLKGHRVDRNEWASQLGERNGDGQASGLDIRSAGIQPSCQPRTYAAGREGAWPSSAKVSMDQAQLAMNVSLRQPR